MPCYLCRISSSKKPSSPKKYCDSCKEKIKNHFLVFNESNEYVGLMEKSVCFSFIRLRKAKPRSFDSITLLDSVSFETKEDFTICFAFLMENGIKEINQLEAEVLVENGWASYINDVSVKMNIKRKTLINSILERDQYKCVFCHTATDCTVFSQPEKDESISTPLNAFCACPRCRTEYTKKDYFKWLNIDESTEEESVKLINHSKTKQYFISHSTASTLVSEKMALYTQPNTIFVLYDRSSFRHLIKKKNNNQCFYCGKKGSTIDHVFPQSKGGLSTPENCVWSCSSCNEEKANMSKEEFEEKI